MTEENENTEENAAAEAKEPASQGKSDLESAMDTVAKAQEVGKRLTGFLGGLAEIANNIDVKELTEKAKQKVNEVKDKASELNAEKTENTIPPRETLSAEQMKNLFETAAKTAEEFPAVVSAVLSDIAQGEQISLKMKFGLASDVVFIAVSAKYIYHFVKNSDQYAVFIYPVSEICGFSLLPPRGDIAGKLTISLKKDEIKLSLGSLESYAQALLLYKKLQGSPAPAAKPVAAAAKPAAAPAAKPATAK
ncbi:MAG: hypothetical protein J5716_06400 [Alphaproteobacteria bacterium]|nr:hypothetical protein [Alphaproteobacteria bacterium]